MNFIIIIIIDIISMFFKINLSCKERTLNKRFLIFDVKILFKKANNDLMMSRCVNVHM